MKLKKKKFYKGENDQEDVFLLKVKYSNIKQAK